MEFQDYYIAIAKEDKLVLPNIEILIELIGVNKGISDMYRIYEINPAELDKEQMDFIINNKDKINIAKKIISKINLDIEIKKLEDYLIKLGEKHFSVYDFLFNQAAKNDVKLYIDQTDNLLSIISHKFNIFKSSDYITIDNLINDIYLQKGFKEISKECVGGADELVYIIEFEFNGINGIVRSTNRYTRHISMKTVNNLNYDKYNIETIINTDYVANVCNIESDFEYSDDENINELINIIKKRYKIDMIG